MSTNSVHKIKVILFLSLSLNLIGAYFVGKRIYYQCKYLNKPVLVERKVNKAMYYHNRQSIYALFPTTRNSIVFVGDSQMQEYDVAEYLKSYPIINRGIIGDISPGVLNRINQIIPGHPQKIFIEIGFNDIGSNITPDSTIKNIKLITRKISSSSPETRIYILNVLPSNSIYGNALVKNIIEINRRLETFCKETKIPLINLYDKFSDRGHLKHKYDCGDGIHLNGQGYLLLTDIVKPYL